MDWRSRISRPDAPAVALHIGGMNRTMWVTPAQYRVAAAVFDGRRQTVRAVAARSRVPRSTAHDALRQLARLGVIVLASARGCRGWTRARVKADVTANVRASGSPVVRLGESLVSAARTFAGGGGRDRRPAGPAGAPGRCR